MKKITGDELPDFYNIVLERPRDDPAGYDVLFIDAAHKVGGGGVPSLPAVVFCGGDGWGQGVERVPWATLRGMPSFIHAAHKVRAMRCCPSAMPDVHEAVVPVGPPSLLSLPPGVLQRAFAGRMSHSW